MDMNAGPLADREKQINYTSSGTGSGTGTGTGWGGSPEEVRSELKEERDRALQHFGLNASEKAKTAAMWRFYFQCVVSILLFVGSAWSLAYSVSLIINVNTYFHSQVADLVKNAQSLDPRLVTLFVTSLASPILLASLGFLLLAVAIRVSRYLVIQKSLFGISQIHHELAAGIGETRPLVQVVQETIDNSRQTFLVQLRLNQAAFGIGLLALVVALGRVMFGQADWVTVGTGATGILAWLFSFINSRSASIQRNLADVTQLELGLVGIAKQVTYLDQWLARFVLDPSHTTPQLLTESKRSIGWALQALQQSTYAASGMVELYAQTAEGNEDEQKERRKLLNQAVKMHAGLVIGKEVSDLADIAGDYATILAHNAKVLTVEDLRQAGATPTDRQKLMETTGIRSETILEFVRLADLMRLPSITLGTIRLLRDAKIDNLADLAKAHSSELHTTVTEINAKQRLLTVSPALKDVENWVAQAKSLLQEITY